MFILGRRRLQACRQLPALPDGQDADRPGGLPQQRRHRRWRADRPRAPLPPLGRGRGRALRLARVGLLAGNAQLHLAGSWGRRGSRTRACLRPAPPARRTASSSRPWSRPRGTPRRRPHPAARRSAGSCRSRPGFPSSSLPIVPPRGVPPTEGPRPTPPGSVPPGSAPALQAPGLRPLPISLGCPAVVVGPALVDIAGKLAVRPGKPVLGEEIVVRKALDQIDQSGGRLAPGLRHHLHGLAEVALPEAFVESVERLPGVARCRQGGLLAAQPGLIPAEEQLLPVRQVSHEVPGRPAALVWPGDLRGAQAGQVGQQGVTLGSGLGKQLGPGVGVGHAGSSGFYSAGCERWTAPHLNANASRATAIMPSGIETTRPGRTRTPRIAPASAATAKAP